MSEPTREERIAQARADLKAAAEAGVDLRALFAWIDSTTPAERFAAAAAHALPNHDPDFRLPPAVQAVLDEYDRLHPVPEDDASAEARYYEKRRWLQDTRMALGELLPGNARCWKEAWDACGGPRWLAVYGDTLVVSCVADTPEDDDDA